MTAYNDKKIINLVLGDLIVGVIMKIACIVLNYNDYNTTISLVEKIKHYNNSIDEIVIVDNCSTDDSIKEFKRSYCNEEKIHIIVSPQNGGYGAGNNLGIDYSKQKNYDYAIIANPDTVFSERCVIALRNQLEKNPKVAVVSATQLDINGKVINTVAWNLMPLYKYVLSFSRFFWRYNIKAAINYSKEKVKKKCVVDCVPGAMIMLRLAAFKDAFDDDIFLYCEETVLGIKAKEAGYNSMLLTNVFYKHNHSVSIDKVYGTKSKKRKLMRDSALIVLKKYYHANSWKMLLAKIFFGYCYIETKIIDIIDCLFKRNN